MFSESKQKFLFKCDECSTILSVEFEEKEDLENLQDDKITLDCPCGGQSSVLRN